MKCDQWRYVAILVGLGLTGLGFGCETQDTQTEEDEEVAEQQRPQDQQDQQDQQAERGDQLPGLGPNAGQQHQQREQQRQGQQQVLGQTAGEAQMQRLQQEGNVARDLMLQSAEISENNLDDDQPEYAELCFEGQVQNVDNPQGFFLQGYDSNVTARAQTVEISEQDDACLNVGFAPGTPLDSYTVAVIAPQAVSNTDDEANVMDSAQLQGATGLNGRTSAPELTDVEVQPADNRAVFQFDEPIEGQTPQRGQTRRGGQPGETQAAGRRTGQAAQGAQQEGRTREGADAGQIDPQKLGFYTSDGRAITGQQIVGVERNRVEVQFRGANVGQGQQGQQPDQPRQEEPQGRREGATQGARLDEAARWFALQGAVTDRQGETGVMSASGETTQAPDLVSVSRQGPTQWVYEFDEAVQTPDPNNFVVYTDGGQLIQGSTPSVGQDDQSVEVTFPNAQDFSDSITQAAVAPQAVQSAGTGARSNTVGGAQIENQPKQGWTSGPDLVEVNVSPDSDQVEFRFDESVNQQWTRRQGQQQGQQQTDQPGQQQGDQPTDQPDQPTDQPNQPTDQPDQPTDQPDQQQPEREGQQQDREPGQQPDRPQGEQSEQQPGEQPDQQQAEQQGQQPDQPQQRGRTGEVSAQGFYVITEDGQIHSASEIVAAGGDDQTVTVSFEQDALQSADSFVVSDGIISDQLGNPNPPHAMGTGQGQTGGQQQDQQQEGQQGGDFQ